MLRLPQILEHQADLPGREEPLPLMIARSVERVPQGAVAADPTDDLRGGRLDGGVREVHLPELLDVFRFHILFVF